MAMKDKREHSINLGKGPGRTRQDQKDSCDINIIMKRYTKQGVLPRLNAKTPVYDDFTTTLSYHESLEHIRRADDLFMELPAEIRAMCENDPALLIPFVEGGEHIDELIEYGVMDPPEGWIHPEKREEVTETSETPQETGSE